MDDAPPQLRGELRTLSSQWTEPRKVMGFIFAGLLTLVAFLSLLEGDLAATLVLFGASVVFWLRAWVGRRLSVVETDGYWLAVSNLSKTAWIPLSQVISVSRVWFPGAQRIYVEVGPDTPFGREIVFEPPLNPAALVGGHPVVEELRALVARAKGTGQRSGS